MDARKQFLDDLLSKRNDYDGAETVYSDVWKAFAKFEDAKPTRKQILDLLNEKGKSSHLLEKETDAILKAPEELFVPIDFKTATIEEICTFLENQTDSKAILTIIKGIVATNRKDLEPLPENYLIRVIKVMLPAQIHEHELSSAEIITQAERESNVKIRSEVLKIVSEHKQSFNAEQNARLKQLIDKLPTEYQKQISNSASNAEATIIPQLEQVPDPKLPSSEISVKENASEEGSKPAHLHLMHVIPENEFYQWLNDKKTFVGVNDAQHAAIKEKLIQLYKDEHARPLVESFILGGGSVISSSWISNPDALGTAYGGDAITFAGFNPYIDVIVHELGHVAANAVYYNYVKEDFNDVRKQNFGDGYVYRPDPIAESKFEQYLENGDQKVKLLYKEESLKGGWLSNSSHVRALLMTSERWPDLPTKRLVQEQLAELGALYFSVSNLSEAKKAQVIEAINRVIPPQDGLSILDFYEQQILPGYVQVNINRKFGLSVENVVNQLVEGFPAKAKFQAKRIITAQFLKQGNTSMLEFIKLFASPNADVPSALKELRKTFSEAAVEKVHDRFFPKSSVLKNPIIDPDDNSLTKKYKQSLQNHVGNILKDIHESAEYKEFLIHKLYLINAGLDVQCKNFSVEKLEALVSPNAQKAYQDKILTVDDLKGFDAAKIHALTSLDAQMLYSDKVITFNELKALSVEKIHTAVALKLASASGNQEIFIKKTTSFLSQAIKEESIETLKELLKTGADKQTALTTACFYGKVDIIKLLITDFKADVNKPDLNGSRALSAAVVNHQLQIVKLLVKEFGVNANQEIYDKWTVLTWLASKGEVDEIKEFVKFGADVNKTDGIGRTVLTILALQGNIEAIKDLIKLDADINKADNSGKTVVSIFAEAGNVDAVKELIKLGADANKADNSGKTVVSIFAEAGNVDSVKDLIKLGADANKANKSGETIVSIFAKADNIDAIKECVNLGVDITHEQGAVAIAMFALKDNFGAVTELLKLGADINYQLQGGPLLTLLVSEAHAKINTIKELIKLGADANKPNSKGETVLDIFVSKDDIAAVEELISLGNEIGKPIILSHSLAYVTTPEMAAALIKAGAIPEEENNYKGVMPYDQLKAIYEKEHDIHVPTKAHVDIDSDAAYDQGQAAFEYNKYQEDIKIAGDHQQPDKYL